MIKENPPAPPVKDDEALLNVHPSIKYEGLIPNLSINLQKYSS